MLDKCIVEIFPRSQVKAWVKPLLLFRDDARHTVDADAEVGLVDLFRNVGSCKEAGVRRGVDRGDHWLNERNRVALEHALHD